MHRSRVNASGGDDGVVVELSASAPSKLQRPDSYYSTPVWEQWQGRNRFFCNGKVMTGPNIQPAFVTAACIIVPVALGAVQTNPFVDDLLGAPVSLIVNLVFLVATLVELYLVVVTCPGVVPRVDRITRRKLGYIVRRPPPDIQHFYSSGKRVRIRYCHTCENFSPPRAAHCPTCDNCVLNYDHHCPWLGACIGKNNYPHFFRFVTIVSILNIFAIAECVVHLAVGISDHDKFDTMWLSLAGIVYFAISACFTVGLWGYHIFLACKGITTFEHLFVQSVRPVVPSITHSCCNQLKYLCGPAPAITQDRRQSILQQSPFHKVDAAMLVPDVTSNAPPPGFSSEEEDGYDDDSNSDSSGSSNATPYDNVPVGTSAYRAPPNGEPDEVLQLQAIADRTGDAFSDNESDGPDSSRNMAVSQPSAEPC